MGLLNFPSESPAAFRTAARTTIAGLETPSTAALQQAP